MALVDPFFIVLGGLGEDQTTEIVRTLRQRFPDSVWSPGEKGNSWDDYKLDLVSATLLRPSGQIFLIAHSFAGQTAIEAANYFANQSKPFRYKHIFLLDPVRYDPMWVSSIDLHPSIPLREVSWYRASFSFPVFPISTISTLAPLTISHTNHNSLCHSDYVIGKIIDIINEDLRDVASA